MWKKTFFDDIILQEVTSLWRENNNRNISEYKSLIWWILLYFVVWFSLSLFRIFHSAKTESFVFRMSKVDTLM